MVAIKSICDKVIIWRGEYSINNARSVLIVESDIESEFELEIKPEIKPKGKP